MSGTKTLAVHDVLRAYLVDGDNVYFYGCLTESNINKTQASEDIRCGFGGGLSSIFQHSMDIDFAIKSAYHSDQFKEFISGNTFAIDQTISLWTNEPELTLAGGTFDITGTPLNDVVKVQDKYGTIYAATWLAGTVTVVDATDGDEYICSYQISKTTADILEFNVAKFPKTIEVLLHGIAYDKDSEEIISDFYYSIPKAKIMGDVSLAYAVSTNVDTDLKCRAIANAAGKLMDYIVVDR